MVSDFDLGWRRCGTSRFTWGSWGLREGRASHIVLLFRRFFVCPSCCVVCVPVLLVVGWFVFVVYVVVWSVSVLVLYT